MPVALQGQALLLTEVDVNQLWQETISYRQHSDDVVTVRCVDAEEMTELNARYRGKATVTNVLTFSYDGEHDIALCVSVAEAEARQLGARQDGGQGQVRDYVALLLVHAFLHATGLDHEESAAEAAATRAAERDILQQAGFAVSEL